MMGPLFNEAEVENVFANLVLHCAISYRLCVIIFVIRMQMKMQIEWMSFKDYHDISIALHQKFIKNPLEKTFLCTYTSKLLP